MDPGAEGPVPFGRYVLQSRLAQGGMGEVFRAVAVGADGFEKPVVVKRILPTHAARAKMSELFVAEAKLMSRLVHPNIVQVIDFGRGPDGAYFLVLEHVEGCDLERLCTSLADRGERLPVPIALHVAVQTLRGLHYAHTRASGPSGGAALVHRDVSPGNVLLSVVGEVKVADFGVALVTGDTGAASGLVVGKLSYMAPEQLDAADVDRRADLFAVGAMTFEMLTGALPFDGEALAYRAAASAGLLRSAAARRPEVSAGLEAVLTRALAPRREDRFADAREMAQAIEALGERLATSDELADLVGRVTAGEIVGRPIVRLGLERPRGAEPVDTPLPTATEIVRDHDGTFTMRATPPPPAPLVEQVAGKLDESSPMRGVPGSIVNDEPPASPPVGDPDDVPLPPKTTLWSWALGSVALTAALGFIITRVVTFGAPTAAPGGSIEASAAPAVAPSREAALEPVETSAPGAPASAAAPRRMQIAGTPPHAPSSPNGPSAATGAGTPSVASANSATQPNVVCRGTVHLYAGHAWLVSGGPSAVQAPGRYEWPCGTYAVVAVSRVDPTEKRHASVAVGAGAPAIVDLR